MTRVIGPTSAFLVGCLLRVIKNGITNIVLPPAFGLDVQAQDFDWIAHPVWGAIWANYQLVDPDGKEGQKPDSYGSRSPLNVFWMDPGDQV